jgi:hypothetical protein
MGKTDVEDALGRLDMLTQEENLMTVARTFKATHEVHEVTQHVDTKVTVIEEVLQQVDGNVRATQDNVMEIQELTLHVDDNVMEIQEVTHHLDDNVMEIQELAYDIKEGTRTIDGNVKVAKDGALIFQFPHIHTDHSLLYAKSNG